MVLGYFLVYIILHQFFSWTEFALSTFNFGLRFQKVPSKFFLVTHLTPSVLFSSSISSSSSNFFLKSIFFFMPICYIFKISNLFIIILMYFFHSLNCIFCQDFSLMYFSKMGFNLFHLFSEVFPLNISLL